RPRRRLSGAARRQRRSRRAGARRATRAAPLVAAARRARTTGLRYKRDMAWVKIPAEHHPLFLAALPKDPRIQTLKMFGGAAGTVNGKMIGATFGRSVI